MTDRPVSRQRQQMLGRKARVQQQIAESPPPRLGALDRDLFTPDEFAVVMGIDVETVLEWIRRGDLVAFDLGGRAGQRIRIEAIREFLERMERERSAARQVSGE